MGLDNLVCESRTMTATLVLPVLNEIEGLKAIVPRLPVVDQIIVLDGGSTDGSLEWCLHQGLDIYVQRQRGLRLGLIEVWPKVRGDVMVTFAPDGNDDPARITPLLNLMRMCPDVDMAIVSRYLDGGRSEDDTPLTRAANWLLTRMINERFGGAYTDALPLFRAYRRELPDQLGILKERSPRWERMIGRWISWEPMLSIRAAKAGCVVREIAGKEYARIGHGRPGWLLPESRISHVKCGVAFLYLIAEESRGHESFHAGPP